MTDEDRSNSRRRPPLGCPPAAHLHLLITTPGDVSIELAGNGGLLIAGDACTNDVIFFENPAWHFGFDTEPEIALKTRQRLLDRAATDKLKMLGYHWSYPGVGYVERKDASYRFVSA